MKTVALTSTTMVNGAFLQEVKESNTSFWAALDRVRAVCVSNNESRLVAQEIVPSLGELRDTFALQISLEETYGYIQSCNPSSRNLAVQAQTAKRQHCELYMQLVEITEQAEEAQYRGTISRDIAMFVEACEQFIENLNVHEELENNLVEATLSGRR